MDFWHTAKGCARVGLDQRGLRQRKPGKRLKSVSLECISAWYSIARAAMCESVTRLAPTPRGGQVPPEEGQMLGAGVDRRDVGEPEPLVHVVDRLRGCCRMGENLGVSHQPHEAGRYNPRDADSLRAVDQVFPPAPGGVVMVRPVVVGIDQQVDVRDYQPAFGPAKSSASSWSLSWFSLRGSMPGRARCGLG